MKKKKILYIILTLISVILFMLALTVFGNTDFVAPFMIILSIYLFVGSVIKLCKMSSKLRNTVLDYLDLLFWIP